MIYSFHNEAELEFNDAIDYYEGCRNDLGFEFASEVYETIQIIIKFPNAWHPLDGNI